MTYWATVYFWGRNSCKWKLILVLNHRSTLMAGNAAASGGGAANPWLINESEETRGLTFGEIKQQQQRIIEGNYTIGVREFLGRKLFSIIYYNLKNTTDRCWMFALSPVTNWTKTSFIFQTWIVPETSDSIFKSINIGSFKGQSVLTCLSALF